MEDISYINVKLHQLKQLLKCLCGLFCYVPIISYINRYHRKKWFQLHFLSKYNPMLQPRINESTLMKTNCLHSVNLSQVIDGFTRRYLKPIKIIILHFPLYFDLCSWYRRKSQLANENRAQNCINLNHHHLNIWDNFNLCNMAVQLRRNTLLQEFRKCPDFLRNNFKFFVRNSHVMLIDNIQ